MIFQASSVPDKEEITHLIKTYLTEKDIAELDFRVMGTIILNRTINLSKKVNCELLEPISKWLDDPDFIKQFEINMEDKPDWAKYKRKQREWTKLQKQIATERLKLYWQEIRRRKKVREELSRIIGSRSKSETVGCIPIEADFINGIVEPFSPVEQNKRELEREFQRIRSTHIADLLPWKTILIAELTKEKDFHDLKGYISDFSRQEKVAKFQHLLQMDKDGEIELVQDSHLGYITIIPRNSCADTEIKVKDKHGYDYQFDWQFLTDNQRGKIIADIKANKILCWSA